MNNDLHLELLIKQMAESHRSELPAPGLIWWRAQILRKQQEQARIERPTTIMRLVTIVVCLVAAAALIAGNLQWWQRLFERQSWLLLGLGIVVLMAALFSVSLTWSLGKDARQ